MVLPLQQPILSVKPSSSEPKPYRYGFIRFLVLALLSFVGFANQYTFNNPQALQITIEQKLSINESQFNMLYTIIAIPNILFSFLSGVVIDYFGIRITFVIMAILMPLFQLVVAFGGMYQSYSLMLTGRFLLGVVDQSILIAIACYVSQWFLGKEISLALGLATTLPQFGNALNSYLTPIIYEKTQSLGAPLFASVGICLIAFVGALVVTYLDVKAEQTDKQIGIEVKPLQDNSELETQQKIRLQDLKALKSTYWLIAVLCMLALAEYVPFLDNSNKLLQVRFCFSQVTAGKNITVTYLVVGVFGFPLGWFMDKIGYKRYFAILCMIIFTLGHFIILVFPQCDQTVVVREWAGVSWGLFLLGIGYCFYANCLIPSIPLVVKKNVIGTAFGLMQMLQNIVMALYPIIGASIISNAKTPQIGYRLFSLYYLANGLLGLLLSTFLLFIHHKDKKRLDSASGELKLQKVVLKQSSTDVEKNQRSEYIRKNRKAIASDDCYQKNESDQQYAKQKKNFLLQIGEYRRQRLSVSEKKNKLYDDSGNQQKQQDKRNTKSASKQLFGSSNTSQISPGKKSKKK